jgi:hypothetical protein
LKKNIVANAYRNITPINKAASDKSEILDLWICMTGESDNRLDGVERGDDDRFPVMTRCVALDDELLRSLIVDYTKWISRAPNSGTARYAGFDRANRRTSRC